MIGRIVDQLNNIFTIKASADLTVDQLNGLAVISSIITLPSTTIDYFVHHFKDLTNSSAIMRREIIEEKLSQMITFISTTLLCDCTAFLPLLAETAEIVVSNISDLISMVSKIENREDADT